MMLASALASVLASALASDVPAPCAWRPGRAEQPLPSPRTP